MAIAHSGVRHEDEEEQGEEDEDAPDAVSEEDGGGLDARSHVVFAVLAGVDRGGDDCPAVCGVRMGGGGGMEGRTYQTVPRKKV